MSNINDTGIISFVTGDETIQLRFGLPANRMLFSRWVNLPDFTTSFNEAEMAWLIFAGYTNACMAKNIEAVKDFEFFYDLVERASLDEQDKLLSDIAACWQNSRMTTKYTADAVAKAEEIKKKNLTGTLSNPSATESWDLNPASTTNLPGDSSS